MMDRQVVIVGGHGSVALRLARLLSPTHSVTSIVRDASHASDITSAGAQPLVLSLEEDDVSKFIDAFTGANVVYFAAGAGGKGGPERTKKVDYEGALKVFDAIEAMPQTKPRLILVSSIDVRHPDKVPEHYTDADKAMSERMRNIIGTYFHWKYEADKNLARRTAFQWTILRPGGLRNEPGNGRVSIGRTTLTKTISRDDVAKVLALLADRLDAAGLALDLVEGEDDAEEALDRAIKKGETDFVE